MEPRYNQRPRDWQNMFVISRLYWGKENRSLYRGFRQKSFVISRFSSEEVRYTKVFVRRGSLYRGFRQKRFVIQRFSTEEVRYIEVPVYRLEELVFAFISITILTAF